MKADIGFGEFLSIFYGEKLMKTYVKYPPRKLQSETYAGPITLQQYQRFQWLRDSLKKDGFSLPLPSGN